MGKIWVLLEYHNDYNQYGGYLVGVWKDKPTREQLLSYYGGGEKNHRIQAFISHLLKGGGRESVEDEWYKLVPVKEGVLIDTEDF